MYLDGKEIPRMGRVHWKPHLSQRAGEFGRVKRRGKRLRSSAEKVRDVCNEMVGGVLRCYMERTEMGLGVELLCSFVASLGSLWVK